MDVTREGEAGESEAKSGFTMRPACIGSLLLRLSLSDPPVSSASGETFGVVADKKIKLSFSQIKARTHCFNVFSIAWTRCGGLFFYCHIHRLLSYTL